MEVSCAWAVPIAVHAAYFCVQTIYIHQQQAFFSNPCKFKLFSSEFIIPASQELDWSSFIWFEKDVYVNSEDSVLALMLKKPNTLQINIKEVQYDHLICKERLHSTRGKKIYLSSVHWGIRQIILLLCMCICDHILSSHIKS